MGGPGGGGSNYIDTSRVGGSTPDAVAPKNVAEDVRQPGYIIITYQVCVPAA